MPIYEYRCASCGHQFDKLQKMGAQAPACPDCGEENAERKVSLTSFQLKGTGWYASDYGSAAGATTSASGSDTGESGGHTCGGGCSHG